MKNLLYLLFFTFIIFSCSDESINDPAPKPQVEKPDPDKEEDVVVPDEPENTATTPCTIDLSKTVANSTIILDCVLDLNGKTITLPPDVKFEFKGGDIIGDGKLIFSGGSIDGRLLSSKLKIEGDVQLKEPTFKFYASRWGIVEGKVPQKTAEENRLAIQHAIDVVKSLTKSFDKTLFNINKLDAFFHGPDKWAYAMKLPSDFELTMTKETHLRAFPSPSDYSTILIMISNSENVTVKNGFLHGERDEHTGPFNISGNLMVVKTGINVHIEGVYMGYAGSDGLDIESYRNAYDPKYIPTRKVYVKDCVFDSNRRNNMAITDGVDITVDRCTFKNAGVDTPNSKGTAPRYSIDIEPDVQDYNRPLQLVKTVKILNCTETGSIGGALVVAAGDDILVSGNTFEKRTAVNTAFNVKIKDNPSLGGVIAGIDGVTGVRNIEVSGNTIINSTPGIRATNQAVKILNNIIKNCGVGIQLYDIKDSTVSGNTITSTGIDGDGINGLIKVENVMIENNNIDVDDRPFLFTGVNTGNETFTFKSNTIKSGRFGIMQGTKGARFIGNTFNNGVRIDKSYNIKIENKNIFNLSNSPIEINGNESNEIYIIGNTINNTNRGRGIVGRGTTSTNKVIKISNNTFNSAVINIEGHNGVSVTGNIVNKWDNNYSFIHYRGQNATFNANKDDKGVLVNVTDIQAGNSVNAQ
ncbi:right-handed parallel beta-helix repeat-containing protein [Aquimarina longa]|uniref:right-handed parallel beta-helix repeat-containing protein n=1 Tax=Aquimarina longa TaxID=1080221 RepID=UPI000783C9B5|nr:right-handed parallel beta-helix repeat-containing protein [Aquimarina longa]